MNEATHFLQKDPPPPPHKAFMQYAKINLKLCGTIRATNLQSEDIRVEWHAFRPVDQ